MRTDNPDTGLLFCELVACLLAEDYFAFHHCFTRARMVSLLLTS